MFAKLIHGQAVVRIAAILWEWSTHQLSQSFKAAETNSFLGKICQA